MQDAIYVQKGLPNQRWTFAKPSPAFVNLCQPLPAFVGPCQAFDKHFSDSGAPQAKKIFELFRPLSKLWQPLNISLCQLLLACVKLCQYHGSTSSSPAEPQIFPRPAPNLAQPQGLAAWCSAKKAKVPLPFSLSAKTSHTLGSGLRTTCKLISLI